MITTEELIRDRKKLKAAVVKVVKEEIKQGLISSPSTEVSNIELRLRSCYLYDDGQTYISVKVRMDYKRFIKKCSTKYVSLVSLSQLVSLSHIEKAMEDKKIYNLVLKYTLHGMKDELLKFGDQI